MLKVDKTDLEAVYEANEESLIDYAEYMGYTQDMSQLLSDENVAKVFNALQENTTLQYTIRECMREALENLISGQL